MLRLASTDEMIFAMRVEHERKLKRGGLVKEALDAEKRVPARVRAGRTLVRLGSRLQGDHAPRALRDALRDAAAS
jgi:hypothetical protein